MSQGTASDTYSSRTLWTAIVWELMPYWFSCAVIWVNSWQQSDILAAVVLLSGWGLSGIGWIVLGQRKLGLLLLLVRPLALPAMLLLIWMSGSSFCLDSGPCGGNSDTAILIPYLVFLFGGPLVSLAAMLIFAVWSDNATHTPAANRQ